MMRGRDLWKHVELRRITLRRAEAHTTMDVHALPDEMPRITLTHRTAGADHVNDNAVRVDVELELTAFDDDGGDPCLKIAATWQVLYERPSEYVPTKAEVREFADTHGLQAVWPYWREFTSGMFGRMDLPFPPMPVFRVS